jgi:hypothetical protein
LSTLIDCYAPTKDSTGDQKDKFYNTLTDLLNTTPKHDINVLIGDLNFKMGNNNTGVKQYMGKQSLPDNMN